MVGGVWWVVKKRRSRARQEREQREAREERENRENRERECAPQINIIIVE